MCLFPPCPRTHGKCWGWLYLDFCFGEKLSSARLYFDYSLSKSPHQCHLTALSIFVPLNSCMSGRLWSLLKTYCYIPVPDFKNLFPIPIRLAFIYILHCPIPIFTCVLCLNSTWEKKQIFCPVLRTFICANNNLPIWKWTVLHAMGEQKKSIL